MKFFDLSTRLITEIKLSGLILSSCMLNGFGCYLYWKNIKNTIHNGIVIQVNPDSDTAMIIQNNDRRYCISKQYFGPNSETNTKVRVRDYVCVIGNTEVDQYDRYWVTPNSLYISGVYRENHPICRLLKYCDEYSGSSMSGK
jgi:hypothetical protein